MTNILVSSANFKILCLPERLKQHIGTVDHCRPVTVSRKLCIFTAVLYYTNACSLEWVHGGILVLVLRSFHEDRLCAKNDYHISVHSDLDLWLFDPKIAVPVIRDVVACLHIWTFMVYRFRVNGWHWARDRQIVGRHVCSLLWADAPYVDGRDYSVCC